MYNNPGQQIQQFFTRGGNPATIVFIVSYVVTWFLHTAMGEASPVRYLAFSSPVPFLWTIATWAMVAIGSPLTLLFSIFVAAWVYGSLERSWGTRNFLGFFFATAAITAISTWLGGRLLGIPVLLADPWVALAPSTVAWAMLNRNEPVGLFFGMAQVPGIWLAAISSVFVWYIVGPPFLGLFALAGSVAAWWYVQHGRFKLFVLTKRSSKPPSTARFRPETREQVTQKSWNPLRWWKERQQRKKLEEMFRRSGFTDEDES
jgi:hypothetical protein